MGLAQYRRMRDFKLTREPRGGRAKRAGKTLSFFIQKHHASRLHYDFRLELDGALKSWAVPKGPSLDPRERRLAVHVEDHPLEYGTFEGTIPRGEYGGGTVLLWDRGEWIPDGDPRAGYRKGHLKFRLRGRKLNGRWALVAMRGAAGRGGKNWLLIKEKDDAARALSDADVLERGESVAGEEKPSPFPHRVSPQLATLAAEVPPGAEWAHEIKYDGYRILAELRAGKASLYSRNGKDWTRRFREIAAAVGALRARDAVLDGEVVVLDERGRSDFQLLQNAVGEGGAAAAVYYAFDLLHLDGRDLRGEPLYARKEALKALLEKAGGRVRYSEHFVGNGGRLFRHACEFALEGIVSKRKDGLYRSGRSTDWLKVKCLKEQEFVIAGFTEPKGARGGFGALALGVMGKDGLRYAGRVGTGFTARSLAELRRRLGKLASRESPFASPPAAEASHGVHWVRPELVAEVAFTGWTNDGLLRHPSFKGLREDKAAAEVVVETPVKDLVAGVRVTHPERVLYPGAGVTKLDVAAYCEAAARRMLPYVARRPLALLRCPGGIGGACFYQKHASGAFSDAVRLVKLREKDGGRKDYLYVEDERGLVALVQGGALEVHPWGSRVEDVERPDTLIFDLDPAPGAPWKTVVAAAREVRERLTILKLESFLKTSGGKGLHVVVPLKATGTWPEAKAFCRAFAELMAADSPSLYTTKLLKAARKGRLFIDYLRNERGATAVAPYSPRARAGAPVSMPVSWDELTPSLSPVKFTILNSARRLAGSDPWSGYEKARRELPR